MVIYLLTALFLGGFGNYLIPLMCRRAGHGVPVHEHAELLGLPARRARAARELLRARRPDRRGLDALSAAGGPARHARRGPRHHPDARLARHLHRRLHDGRPQLRDDRAAGALHGHDDDAHAALGVGHLHGDDPRPARLPGAARLRGDDDARRDARHQLLHAGRDVARRDSSTTTAAARSCSSTCSGSSATPRSTSSRCPPSASSPTCSRRTRARTSSATG